MTKLQAAPDGDQALSDMWRWTRSVLAAITEQRPEAADALSWELARQMALFTARMPRAKIARRAGLTPEEVDRLLDPWKTREGDRR